MFVEVILAVGESTVRSADKVSLVGIRVGADHPPIGGGAYMGKKAPYGSERPYIDVKGPHESERSP